MMKFTDSQIQSLHQQFDSLKRVDPCGEKYKELVEMVQSFPPSLQRQVRDARIRWLSYECAKQIAIADKHECPALYASKFMPLS